LVKYVYPVWREASRAGDDFRRELIEVLAPELLAPGRLKALRIAVVDDAVAPASSKRMENCQPLPDGVVSVYLNDSAQDEKACIDTAVEAHVARFTCYRASETEVLSYDVASGQRVPGFCQLVFLQRPARLTESKWLELWQGRHTQVAVDTQATFGYRQNVLTGTLSDSAPVLHAMIEENFPSEAMSSDLAFYGASDEQNLQARLAAMMASCTRFIDFDKIDVIPMSEYFFRG